jgi:hypothetical protein
MCSLEVAHQYTYNNLTCKPPLIISEVATARAYNQKICRESWTATERMFGSVWYWESYAGFVRDLLHPTPRMIPEEFTESEEEPEVPEVEVPQEPKQEIICVSVCCVSVCLCVCVALCVNVSVRLCVCVSLCMVLVLVLLLLLLLVLVLVLFLVSPFGPPRKNVSGRKRWSTGRRCGAVKRWSTGCSMTTPAII